MSELDRMAEQAEAFQQDYIPSSSDEQAEVIGTPPDNGYDDLSYRLDQLEQATGDYTSIDNLPSAEGVDVREHLEGIAAQTRDAVFRASNVDPTAPMPGDVVGQAMAIVTEGIPDFMDTAEQVHEYLAGKGVNFQGAIAAGDYLGIAKTLLNAHFVTQSQAQDRQVKRAAQTISGASSRPAAVDPDDAYWQLVKQTNPGSYRALGIL